MQQSSTWPAAGGARALAPLFILMGWLFFSAALAIASIVSPSLAATYFVRPDGKGDFPTIQQAIDAAHHGDIIELADGTFVGDGNRHIDYRGKILTIRSRVEFRPCIIDCEGSEADPHLGFNFHSSEGPSPFWRRWRSQMGTSLPGAIWIENESSPTIRHCIFSHGTAISGGGAIYCNDSSPTFIDCCFVGNVQRT
jgi:hypothetical protein